MSRNYNLRKIAEKLPKTPNLKDGKPQYDSKGDLITANHFRRLKIIVEDCQKMGFSSKHPNTFKHITAYTKMVLKYDEEYQKKFGAKSVSNWGIYIFLIISLLAIIIKYWR